MRNSILKLTKKHVCLFVGLFYLPRGNIFHLILSSNVYQNSGTKLSS